jgi:hypothetical protein
MALCNAACNRGAPSSDAVRQGVLDHLAQAGLNVAGMDVTMTSVQITGNQADAAVSIAPKGVSGSPGMLMKYHLQQQADKWVVVGRQDTGQSPHGAIESGAAMAPAANPHGGGAMPGTGTAGKMPSPEDLPPATKK